MNFFKRIFGSQICDEPLEAQQQDINEWLAVVTTILPGLLQMNEGCDEIANATGSFGYSETNPIPVNGPAGECVYLQRLKAKTGVGCFFHRVGSLPATNLNGAKQNQAIDVFEVVASDASQWATLYFLMYFPRRSLKCPDGFFLKSWNSMNDVEKIGCKLPVFGHLSKVNNFPLGLPEAVENSPKLKSSDMPRVGASFARKIRDILKKHDGEWHRPNETAN